MRQKQVPGFMIDMLRFKAVLSLDFILETVPVTLRSYVYGVMSQRVSQNIITYLQGNQFHLKISEAELFYVRMHTNT